MRGPRSSCSRRSTVSSAGMTFYDVDRERRDDHARLGDGGRPRPDRELRDLHDVRDQLRADGRRQPRDRRDAPVERECRQRRRRRHPDRDVRGRDEHGDPRRFGRPVARRTVGDDVLQPDLVRPRRRRAGLEHHGQHHPDPGVRPVHRGRAYPDDQQSARRDDHGARRRRHVIDRRQRRRRRDRPADQRRPAQQPDREQRERPGSPGGSERARHADPDQRPADHRAVHAHDRPRRVRDPDGRSGQRLSAEARRRRRRCRAWCSRSGTRPATRR